MPFSLVLVLNSVLLLLLPTAIAATVWTIKYSGEPDALYWYVQTTLLWIATLGLIGATVCPL